MSELFDHDEKQAARILGVSTRTMKSYRAKGQIGFYRLHGGRIRYATEQLTEFVRSTRVGVPAIPQISPHCPAIPHNGTRADSRAARYFHNDK